MPKIRSNKALKYDPIKPQLEGVVQLEIIEVKDYLEQGLTVVTVRDSIVTTVTTVKTVIVDGEEVEQEETVEQFQQLNIRNKTFTFEQVNDLESLLSDQLTVTEPYMARRLQLLSVGLLFITQNDEYPLYFSTGSDWELVD